MYSQSYSWLVAKTKFEHSSAKLQITCFFYHTDVFKKSLPHLTQIFVLFAVKLSQFDGCGLGGYSLTGTSVLDICLDLFCIGSDILKNRT